MGCGLCGEVRGKDLEVNARRQGVYQKDLRCQSTYFSMSWHIVKLDVKRSRAPTVYTNFDGATSTVYMVSNGAFPTAQAAFDRDYNPETLYGQTTFDEDTLLPSRYLR